MRKFKATIGENHTLPIADNLLDQKFVVPSLNRIWTNDITYIPTDEGWIHRNGQVFSDNLQKILSGSPLKFI